MSTVDWPPLDAHAMPLPTIVSSSDLFDGELFGDELIDIYNNSVDHEGVGHHGKSCYELSIVTVLLIYLFLTHYYHPVPI